MSELDTSSLNVTFDAYLDYSLSPVMQTTFHDPANPGSGNCVQACLASFLGVGLMDIPNLWKDGATADRFWHNFRKTAESYGWRVMMHEDKDLRPDFPYFASGVSPRDPEVRHMVVMQGEHLLHDPHPDGTGVTAITTVWTLHPLEPWNTRNRRLESIRFMEQLDAMMSAPRSERQIEIGNVQHGIEEVLGSLGPHDVISSIKYDYGNPVVIVLVLDEEPDEPFDFEGVVVEYTLRRKPPIEAYEVVCDALRKEARTLGE